MDPAGSSAREREFIECLQLLDEGGDPESAAVRFRGLKDGIESLGETIRLLREAQPSEAAAVAQASSRRQVLSALGQPRRRGIFRLGALNRTAAGALATVLLFAGVAGAAAANLGGMSELGPVSEVLSAVGLAGDSNDDEAAEPSAPAGDGGLTGGSGVNEDVQKAIEETEPGPARGIAVSEAACEAAHDSDRLPDAAQAAKDESGQGSKDCEHPNADGTPGAGKKPEETGAPDAGPNAGGAKPEEPPGKPAEPPANAPSDPPGKPQETPGSGNGGGSQGSPPGHDKKP